MIARVMKHEPLPSQVDIRKLATKGTDITAKIKVNQLPRLQQMLHDADGEVEVKLHFAINDQGKLQLSGAVQAEVSVTCQRCMGPMPYKIDSSFDLVAVWSDEEAAHLDKDLDPLILEDELVDLKDVVEEELILSVPFVSYHDIEDCLVSKDDLQSGELVEDEPRENPFNVLGQFKASMKTGDKES